MGGVYFAYMGRRNPITDCVRFFLGERYPWRNHACQIWWRSLKGFRGSCGSNFSISHWLCWSSLQHSRTTVWACDVQSCFWRSLNQTEQLKVFVHHLISCYHSRHFHVICYPFSILKNFLTTNHSSQLSMFIIPLLFILSVSWSCQITISFFLLVILE